MIDSLGLDGVDQEISKLPKFDYQDFTGDVSVKNLSLTYPGKELPALKNINLELKSGSAVAIVGPSGAGKTSLVDAILGVLLPDSGVVEISGMPALESARKWSGAIAYVPQDIMIIDGTISENVVLGYQTAGADEKYIWDALESAQLEEFVRSLPDGLSTLVGERGAKLSGGQRQRLGIARALFTKPKLLVLDEATSSLDGQTESEITASIKKLKGEVTVLLIAHRLSTVREADLVVYMEKGSILATGSFEHVRSAIPDFDHQAELMGL